MSTKSQFYFMASQDAVSAAGENQFVFDFQHGIFGDSGELASAGVLAITEDGGSTLASALHAPDLSIGTTGLSVSADATDGSLAESASSGVYGDANKLSGYTAHVAIDHTDAFNIQSDDTSFVDQPQHQLSNLSLDGVSGGWPGISNVDDAQPQHLPAFDSLADTAGPSFAQDAFVGFIDAKGGGGHLGGGGGGGGHSGGGGGGGGGLPTTYTSGDPNVADANEFNIHIDFGGSWTAQEQAIVTWAADLWSQIITGDVRDDTDLNGNPVDDVNISMNIGRIDGSGNPITGDILAQTQITAVRDPGSIDQWLPVTSSITLDSTDLKNSINQGWSGTWDTIVMHEMGHALGFAGVVFDNLGLVDSFGNFSGANAVAAYGTGTSVPLEQDGGSGTAGSHWDEATFAPGGVQMSNELMTGYVVQNEQTYLSDTTVGAMADLGYQVQDPSVGSDYLTIDNHLLLA